MPCLIFPVENIGVDNFAWSVNVLRLKPGGGVGAFFFPIDPKIIERPGPCRIGGQFKPTLIAPLKRNRFGRLDGCEGNFNLMYGGSPQPKANTPIPPVFGAEGHVMTALPSTLPWILPSCRSRAAPSGPPWIVPATDRRCRTRAYRPRANRLRAKCPS